MNTYHDKFLSYDLYDSMLSSTPPRSQFYHLQPLGLNTPYTESLTSYIIRLAQAHGITLTDFIKYAIHKPTKNMTKSPTAVYVGSLHSEDGYGINGIGELANTWVDIVEQLTLQTNLQSLTMLPWRKVIGIQGLMRSVRAWCSSCYEIWHRAEQPLYDLLIWSFKEVILCPYHKQYLQTKCPQCERSLPVLSTKSKIGYCPHCYIFLGLSALPRENESTAIDETQIQQHLWISHTIGDLITAAPLLSRPLERNSFDSNISRFLQDVARNSQFALGRYLDLPETTASALFKGTRIPPIKLLFKLCHTMGVSLLTLLTENIYVEDLDHQKVLEVKSYIQKSSKNKYDINPDQLRHALEDELLRNEIPPPSLDEVAERVGSFVKTLRTHCPKLCRKIEVRYRKYHNVRLVNVQPVLEQAIANQENPPPSVSQIARQFGFQPGVVFHQFPKLTHQITERHNQAKIIYLDSVRQALEQAIESHIHPPLTVQEIAQQQGCSTSMIHRRFPDLCRALTAKRHAPIDAEELRQILRGYLAPLHAPPVSFAEVARQLKVSKNTISRLCPDEVKAISVQYLTYQANMNQQRKQRLADEARQVTLQLYAEGIYPSAVRVMERLSKPGNMKLVEVFNAWKQVVSELNLSSSNIQDDLTEFL